MMLFQFFNLAIQLSSEKNKGYHFISHFSNNYVNRLI